MNKKNNDNAKILLASLAGLGAGVVAGLLLAPEQGRSARQSVMQGLTEAGDEVNQTLKRWTAKVRSMSGQGQAGDEDQLVMHGSWADVKGQLRNNYDELTEEDLDYQEGNERELLDRLQRKLGKTKDEVVRLISQIGQ